ncbi:MAG: hypothetical protein Q4P29_00240 [Tissierellia bacterium]|nr:hypothetical protein [Tissierellia bacterium]
MKYENRLESLQKKLQESKMLKVKAETRLEELQRQEKLILEELDKLGIKPKDLDSEINKLQTEIEELFNQAEKLLPQLNTEKIE